MTVAAYGAWICLLSPLAAAGAITLAGGRLSRRGAGYLATLACFVAFGGALTTFISLLGRSGDGARLLPPDPEGRLARVRDPRGSVQLDRGEPRRARTARRRGRQVGAASAADVAARRDGRPDARQRPDPRGDDGDRGRLS